MRDDVDEITYEDVLAANLAIELASLRNSAIEIVPAEKTSFIEWINRPALSHLEERE